MIALYKKELRGLLPLLVLIGVIFGSDFFYRSLDERVDEISWLAQSGQLGPGEGREYAAVLLVVVLIAAYSAFPREHDEGTIELLYSLPITRPRIFLAKALAAASVVAAGIVLDHLAGAVFSALNPQSFSGEQWRFGLAAKVAALDIVFSVVILAHGLLISFLRRFGVLLYVIAAFAVLQVKKHWPALVYLDPTELLAFDYHGLQLVVPWRGLAFHGAVAVAAVLAAYALWMGPAERVTRLYTRVQARLAGRMALGCVTFTLFGLGLVWMTVLAFEEDEATPPVRYRRFLPVRAETVWYDFTYASNLGERARPLIRRSDPVYEAVAAAMTVEPGFRIDADLTDEAAGHDGIAQGGVIRLALERLDDDAALYTLHHETVHAFQSRLAGRRLAEHWRSLRFFVEGSAEYVAGELLPDAERRRAHRRLAAAAFERHDLRFEDLIDDDELRAVHDADLVYVLGETWTAALAEVCGADAPGRVFRALDRVDAPEDLAGIALWQDTLGAVSRVVPPDPPQGGCALEPVVARWGENMSEIVRQERAFLGQLPRLGGGVVSVEDGWIVVHGASDRPVEGGGPQYYLRVRRGPDVPADQVYTATAEVEDGVIEFWVPQGWVGDGSFELQIGQSIEGAQWAFFEVWQDAVVP